MACQKNRTIASGFFMSAIYVVQKKGIVQKKDSLERSDDSGLFPILDHYPDTVHGSGKQG